MIIAWQDRKNLGFFQSLWQTVKDVLLKPRDFFDALLVADRIQEPYVFYLLISLPVMAFCSTLLFPANANFIFFVLMSCLSIFLAAGLVHAGVLMLGGKKGFKQTFNVLAYAAPANIGLVVPYVGVFVSMVWGVYIGVIGLKKIHGLNTWKALVAYTGMIFVVPFVLISMLLAVAIPLILTARVPANDALARSTVQMISTGIEEYAVDNNGQYPLNEELLRQKGYLKDVSSDRSRQGHAYSFALDQTSYKVTAVPRDCRVTGRKVFTVSTGGILAESECQVKPAAR